MSWRRLLPVVALALPLATGCRDSDDEDAGDDDGEPSADDSGEWGDGSGGDGGGSDSTGGATVDAFVSDYAAALCAWATECQLLDVFGGTPAACIETVEGQLQATFGGMQCDYDPVAAQQCVDGLSRSTCDEPHEDPACAEVCG